MRNDMRTAALVTAAALLCGLTAAPAHADDGREILVTDSQGLIDALADARAGDTIVLREGVYENSRWLGKSAAFFGEAEGTAAHPITLRSEDPEHPATIRGQTQEHDYALYILGDYWRLEDLKIGNASKGLILDHSSHSVISGCEIFDTGSEGLHIRDNSSYCLIEDCYIHDTGTLVPKYGEGIYIGSAIGTTGYGFDCHYNTVRRCEIARVGAECVDIKEFTIGTVVEDCTFDGSGIKGENGANSFIEIKGNDCTIRRNVGYRNGNQDQLYGFDLYCPTPEWGQNARIYENTFYLDSVDIPYIAGWRCSALVFRNKTEPEGCPIGSNGDRIKDVQAIECLGDANEDARVDAEDVQALGSWIHGTEAGHLSDPNADMNGDGVIEVFDLALVKRTVVEGTAPDPVMTVPFTVEKPGKFRASNGLGNGTVTYEVVARPGTEIDLVYMYWDPHAPNEETGKDGKNITVSLGTLSPDADGHLTVSFPLPEDAVSLALEAWHYREDGKELDKADLSVARVTVQ